jgi:phosphatidylserine/phosphatidylglycerophosphate/cardiolipin synthase-like enzyme
MAKSSPAACYVTGKNEDALFSLKLHRGEGMLLIAMDWKKGRPPRDFVGFAIEYQEPGGDKFYPLKNRIAFPGVDGKVNPARLSTRESPIQKFRWVHFPRNADLEGEFTYRVTPVFMGKDETLSYGEAQQARIVLARETYPGRLNVTFTRGFVSSQAFVDKFQRKGEPVSTLIAPVAHDGLDFKPTHPKAAEALPWMGFEARRAILDVLDEAAADASAQVRVVAYDFNLPDVLQRLLKVAKRLKIIVDDSKDHRGDDTPESRAAAALAKAGAEVKREHMSNLQHNKTLVVDGAKCKAVVCGSTNFSWRGFYIQNNNALVLRGPQPVAIFGEAFDNYWSKETAKTFGPTRSAGQWRDLGFQDIDASVTFSPHGADHAVLDSIAEDVEKGARSCVLYSLAFLAQTTGAIRTAVTNVTKNKKIFVYGMADRAVGGLQIGTSGGNLPPVYPAALAKNLPEPFKKEPTGLAGESENQRGTRMHHKFVVLDFDRASARVYVGSYNFSNPADRQNGENLLLVKDRRVATAFMVEALRIFDHYHFRVLEEKAKKTKKPKDKARLQLKKPPEKASQKAWFDEDFENPQKIRDRQLFA